ncbi:SDR family NAD(P)-dependent oxidoreductase [Fibrella sp. HMF5335]|uniref:SDR family NAD(P)-dependent oxidoreductase n=1 Tax=Fibrella rubiginis TaxID=2817060 RepID=A0A939GGB9_9BACT|nr:NAD-dependent epimerase/dehydratase family protein [Fibrella rubiginis]MBO0936285.1 SDR family NAD(P)-dependent oxidoreductase [Fibrella rubiginis]
MINNVLVTGGAGYIGSQLVRILLDEGYHVSVIDNLKFGGEALMALTAHPRFTFHKGDLRVSADVERAVAGVDAICHLAAIVGDPACRLYPEEATEVNCTASEQLFETAERMGVQRFVFASTCSNYGKMDDASAYVVEESALAPVSHYAETKVAFENYLMRRRASPVVFTILRFATVYGISPRIRFDLTANEFTRDVTVGKELTIFGEQFWRPYCHVYDLANAMALTLKSDKNLVQHEVFNVGSTAENYTKKMLVGEIGQVVPTLKVQYIHKDEDPRDYRVNCDKISQKLGFAITRTLPEGIREVHRLVRSGLITDSYSARYRNI